MKLPTILGLLALALLIWKPELSALAMQKGLFLCLGTLIPSLFPFLVLGKYLCRNGKFPTGRGFMERVFGLPGEAAPAVILGAIGGYPVGAQLTADLYRAGGLRKEEAERLLGFCNYGGPAFFFGVLGAMYHSMKIAGVLYGIHLCAGLFVGILLKPGKRSFCTRAVIPQRPVEFSEILWESLRTMGMICGYVLLFQVGMAFLGMCRLPLFWEILLSGLLEMSSGCLRLPELDALQLSYCMASGFLGFGGLCITMQTRSVIARSGLSGTYYLFGKTLQSVLAVLLTWLCLAAFPSLLPEALPAASVGFHAHEGLLGAIAAVSGAFLGILGIWCLHLKKRAGKAQTADV